MLLEPLAQAKSSFSRTLCLRLRPALVEGQGAYLIFISSYLRSITQSFMPRLESVTHNLTNNSMEYGRGGYNIQAAIRTKYGVCDTGGYLLSGFIVGSDCYVLLRPPVTTEARFV